MQERWQETPTSLDGILMACARASTSAGVRRALASHYKLSREFKITVVNGDDPKRANHCDLCSPRTAGRSTRPQNKRGSQPVRKVRRTRVE